ncbi:MAG: hypothetical protein HKN67_10640 [Saprospiraceae bacterium]|nr:hypothetical protein [Saprospiraceae bacterium]
MTKLAIGSLVGGLLIFIWQFLSWSMLNTHGANYQYTENQDAIMEALNANLSEDGGYMIPNMAPDATKEQQEAYMAESEGKPWVTINYHKAWNTNMGMNMFRGFVANVVAAFLLAWLLMQFREVDLITGLKAGLAVGATGYLVISYINSVWFETSSIGYLIDTIVQWGLCGIWLGFWLGRK